MGTPSDERKKEAVSYIFRVSAQKVLGLLFYLLGSRWTMNSRSWIYFGLYLISGLLIVPIYKKNPEILAQRGKVVTDSPLWDKILLSIYWLLDFFIIYLAAGLEAKRPSPFAALFWAGTGLFFVAAVISLAAAMVNTYLESTARIQAERDQRVVSRGVYGIVRHPAYLAVLIFCLARILIFGTPLTIATAAIIAVVIILRTYLEDRMLKEQLAGYTEYSRKTRYRLVPYIW